MCQQLSRTGGFGEGFSFKGLPACAGALAFRDDWLHHRIGSRPIYKTLNLQTLKLWDLVIQRDFIKWHDHGLKGFAIYISYSNLSLKLRSHGGYEMVTLTASKKQFPGTCYWNDWLSDSNYQNYSDSPEIHKYLFS